MSVCISSLRRSASCGTLMEKDPLTGTLLKVRGEERRSVNAADGDVTIKSHKIKHTRSHYATSITHTLSSSSFTSRRAVRVAACRSCHGSRAARRLAIHVNLSVWQHRASHTSSHELAFHKSHVHTESCRTCREYQRRGVGASARRAIEAAAISRHQHWQCG